MTIVPPEINLLRHMLQTTFVINVHLSSVHTDRLYVNGDVK